MASSSAQVIVDGEAVLQEGSILSDSLRWPREAWFPLAAGLFWLWRAPEHGLPGFVFSVIPGCLLLGSGVAMLLMPGDRRIANFAAAGGMLGLLFALPAFFVVGFGAGLLLVAASALSFIAAGARKVTWPPWYHSIRGRSQCRQRSRA
jgi:hypothetical protein